MPEAQDLTTAIAVEVAKQIPVSEAYGDALSPGMKQTGSLVEDLVKTLRLALAPIQFTAAIQDRYAGFLNRSIRRVPGEQRVAPPPQILGPVIEAIKYEPEGSDIEDMFSELLSRAFDKERVNEAHPSFPHLIKQLSADEALILKIIAESTRSQKPMRTTIRHKLVDKRFYFETIENNDFPAGRLYFADNLQFYMEHLWALNLAGIFEYRNQETLATGGRQTGVREFREYRLTEIGTKFAAAVLPQLA